MSADAGIERDLALRLRLEALAADYVHCIDEDRLEDWPEFFTEDGLYRVTTRENLEQGLPLGLIYCDGKGMLKDRISALRQANIFEPHVYCHMVGALRLLGRDGDAFRARSNFTVTRTMADGAMSVFACGKYLDRVVETGGGLKYAERTVVLDSRRIDTLLVIPI